MCIAMLDARIAVDAAQRHAVHVAADDAAQRGAARAAKAQAEALAAFISRQFVLSLHPMERSRCHLCVCRSGPAERLSAARTVTASGHHQRRIDPVSHPPAKAAAVDHHRASVRDAAQRPCSGANRQSKDWRQVHSTPRVSLHRDRRRTLHSSTPRSRCDRHSSSADRELRRRRTPPRHEPGRRARRIPRGTPDDGSRRIPVVTAVPAFGGRGPNFDVEPRSVAVPLPPRRARRIVARPFRRGDIPTTESERGQERVIEGDGTLRGNRPRYRCGSMDRSMASR